MLRHLIRKEVLNLLLSSRYQVLAGVSALCIWGCLIDGSLVYTAGLAEHGAAQALSRDRLETIGEQGLGGFDAEGFYIHKPPLALSIMTRSVDPVLGRSKRTGWTDRGAWLKRSPAGTDPPIGAFLPLDLGVIVEVVLSLFCILLTFDAVCGEKEEGTLRLTTSTAVSRGTILLAKAGGAIIAVLSTFWIPFLLGVAVLIALPDIDFSTTELGRIATFGITVSIFLGTFVCVGLLGSVLTSRPATAFVILVGYWAVVSLVLPRLSLIAANIIRPAPSLSKLTAGYEAISSDRVSQRVERWREWEETYLAEHGRPYYETPEGREAGTKHNQGALDRFLKETAADRKVLDDEFQRRYEARTDLAETFGNLSPAFALRNALADLCGTGLTRHNRFIDALAAYLRDQYRPWVKGQTWEQEFSNSNPEKYGPYDWDPAKKPVFTYTDSWPLEEVRGAFQSAGLLALWAVLFFAGAFVGIARFDPR